MESENDILTLQREIDRLKGALKNMNVIEKEREESRRAMLNMLEDLEDSRASIEHAKQEWVNAFDAVADPIFIHDENYRVTRANRAYAEQAGIAFPDIIGRPYYESFPVRDGPLPSCSDRVKHDNPDVDAEEIELDNGEIFLSRAFAIHDSAGKYVHSIHIMQNITERRRAELALRDSEAFSRTIIESSTDCIKTLTLDGCLLSMNASGQQLMEIEDFSPYLKTSWLGFWQGEDHKAAKLALASAVQGDIGHFSGFVASAKGTPRWWDVVLSPIRDSENRIIMLLAVSRDITEARHQERAIAESEKNYRSLFEDALDMIHVVDPDCRIEDANLAEQVALGYSRDELIGKSLLDIVHPDYHQLTRKNFDLLMSGGEIKRYESLYIKRSGETFPVEVSAVGRKVDGNVVGIRAFVRDISERKRAEKVLAENEEKFRKMTSTAQDAILMMDAEGSISYFNPAAETMFGYGADEVMGKKLHDLITPQRYRQDAEKGFEQFKKSGEGPVLGKSLNLEALRRDGSEFPIELSISAMELNGQWSAVAFIRDTTQRFEMEQKLLRENRARRVISSSNSMLVHADDESALLDDICNLIVTEDAYPLAWVVLAENGIEKLYRVAAYAGVISDDELGMLGYTWADNEQGQGPAARAMRECGRQLVIDAQHTEACETCRQMAIEHDYHSILTFPLMKGPGCFGALTITASGIDDFSAEEIGLLQELADDLAYGMVSLRAKQDRDKAVEQQRATLEKLKTNLNTTVQAMASAVEARDPYTAGHQRHVAQLATAIATEMGLSEYDVEGIRIAATIHDLGKIYVPSEILSKPGRITPNEFELIKTHSQVGYDILKDIDFPWPVAKMVWQHHERIDGTGYPQGLKGDEIELGAKIIAVADVTEAIASSRPYRAALGIEFALEIVEKDRGKAFDPEAVDACLRLFHEKKYTLDLA